MQVVLGDALAVALIERRGFTRSDFLTFHPGGRLGAQLATVATADGARRERADGPHRRHPARRDVRDEPQALWLHGGGLPETIAWSARFTDGDLRRSFASKHLGGDIRDAHDRDADRSPRDR